MDNDKTERTMQFILEQQAQNTVAIGQLTDTVRNLSNTVDKLSDKVDRTADSVNALLAIAEIHDREIAALRESATEHDERGRQTDERLNALINSVERYISERRNGNA
jgi:biopolymer transport protein ExbB/TolQ